MSTLKNAKSNLADWFITMRGCVKYIHNPDPDTTLNFDLKVKF